MREILFKGAQKVDGSKSLYWYEGSLVIETDSYTGEKEYYIQNESGSYLVIPETVGQYTGLTDKNGTKIFEGDIVNNGCKGVVEYDDLSACFSITTYIQVNGYNIPDDRNSFDFRLPIEIIGNIYDNSELLEATE